MRFDQKLQDIGQAFAGAADEKTLFSIAGRALADYGREYFSFGEVLKNTGSVLDRSVHLIHQDLPTKFWTAMNAHNLYRDSPIMRRFMFNGQDSLFEDPSVLLDASPTELALIQSQAEAGFRRGYMAAFDGRAGYRTGMSMLLDQYSKSDLALIWPELKPQLIAIGQMLDTAFFTTHIAAHYGLAPRERDVLSWLAAGLRPDEIADKLAIGYRTVDKYIVSAKEKLNARTRDHAVARAVILKLI